MTVQQFYVRLDVRQCQPAREKLARLGLLSVAAGGGGKKVVLNKAEGLADLPLAREVTQEQLEALLGDVAVVLVSKEEEEEEEGDNKKRRRRKGPAEVLMRRLAELFEARGLEAGLKDELAGEVPRRWQQHGDLVLLPHTAFTSPAWEPVFKDVLAVVCDVLSVRRVARRHRVASDGHRTPRTDLLLGTDGWVSHKDNGITYGWDVTKCMFSAGNITEKMRVGGFDCRGETVVDMFAGIGYFTLPYLVNAKADRVIACEWNPDAASALRLNLERAGVAWRCTVLQGDNRTVCPPDVADRVNLGLIPSSEGSWAAACRALKPAGGRLHVHANVEHEAGQPKSEVWSAYAVQAAASIRRLLSEVKGGGDWTVDVVHIEEVKSYAPRVHHLVVDLQCGRL